MTVHMAHRTLSQPLGVFEDIPVMIGKFFIPVDFVVLDNPEDSYTPIILGRPYLLTARAVIDVRGKTLTFQVGDEELIFYQSNVRSAPIQVQPCNAVPSIDPNTDSPVDNIEPCAAILTHPP
ncbi:uncharacterized protein LOC141595539 [Silene latifolia]|uniref:uncharacterized protein LOC141595539 n=1 Tax=Silene latifolia TaxID=37657 RepID=UPI003D76E1B8